MPAVKMMMQKIRHPSVSLEAKLKQYKDHITVTVSYTAPYAIFVHENMEIWPPGMRLAGKPRPKGHTGNYWEPNGQPKYLEHAAKILQPVIHSLIVDILKRGGDILVALLTVGQKVKEVSQTMVPVDTGKLRDSASVDLENL